MYHIKNDKRSLQSSRWIYEALELLMHEKKYEDITITEIVNRAKVGRATFYRHFDTIDDVLRLKCDAKFAGLALFFAEYYQLPHSSDSSFHLKPFLRYWYVHSHIIELLIQAGKEDMIREALRHSILTFSGVISSREGAIKRHLNYFIEVRTAISISILTEWIKNKKDIAPDALADIINQQFKESYEAQLML